MCLFVRDLRYDESQKLNRWLRNSRNGIQMRRVQVIALAIRGCEFGKSPASLV